MIKRLNLVNFNPAVSSSNSNFRREGSIDVREFESFSCFFHHEGNTGTVTWTVQASLDPDPTASRWVSVPTAAIPYPSSQTQGAGALTTSVRNEWSYIRVLIQTDATAAGATASITTGILRFQIGGHVRHIK